MVTLSFTDKELEILNEYFQSELYKAEQKIDTIKEILGKIGKKHGKETKEIKPEKKHGDHKKEGKAKRGRPPLSVAEKQKREKKKLKNKKSRHPKTEAVAIETIAEALIAPVVMPAAVLPVPDEVMQPAEKQVAEKSAAKAKESTKAKASKAKARKKPKPAAKKKTPTKPNAAAPAKPMDIDWEEGILGIVRDNPQLTATQISQSLIEKYSLKGSQKTGASRRVEEKLAQLEGAGTLMAYGDEGEALMYGLNLAE